MPVPWPVIVSALPTLIDTASRLLKKADKPPAAAADDLGMDERLQSLQQRVEYLEAIEAEQAALTKETLEKLRETALAVSAANRRANIALGIAVVAAALAVAALAWR